MANLGKNQNIIYGALAVGAIGYLLYVNKKNKEEGSVLLQYINNMPSQTNLTQATEQGIASVQNTKVDTKKIRINKMIGDYKNPKIRNEIAKTVTELWASMKGIGTDNKAFWNALSKIQSKNTLAFVNQIYKSQYKETLFEAMKNESALNNKGYAVYSDATKYDIMIPLLSGSHWNPLLATYFNNLPVY